MSFLLLLQISMNAEEIPMIATYKRAVQTEQAHLFAFVTADTQEMADNVWVCLYI